MKTIQLTNSDLVVLVDDSDYAYLVQWTWRISPKGYAYRWEGNPRKNTLKIVFIHGAIMQVKGIDHKDRNKLNNQRTNLRIADQSQNNANKHTLARKTIKSKSQYKGVSWYNKTNKWIAQIQQNYKKLNLGYFTNEIDAAKAYNAKALELFGEFAYLNNVERIDLDH